MSMIGGHDSTNHLSGQRMHDPALIWGVAVYFGYRRTLARERRADQAEGA